MEYETEKDRMVPNRDSGLDAKEGEATWTVLMVALAIIGVMYVYDQAFAQKKQADPPVEIKELYWQWSYVPPAECRDAMAGDNRAQCEGHRARARADFEAEWNRKITSGWTPPRLQLSQASLRGN